MLVLKVSHIRGNWVVSNIRGLPYTNRCGLGTDPNDVYTRCVDIAFSRG
jgi:hypothetical protein